MTTATRSSDVRPETAEAAASSATFDEPGRVWVTGASGFVGRYVVRELIAQGHQPVCLVRDPDKLMGHLTPDHRRRVETVPGDLFDREAMARAAKDCRAAIHLVGIIMERRLLGQTFSRIHVEATRNVLDSCRRAGIRRYAHMSALGSRPGAVSRYHQTKWSAEELVRASSLDWTIFRPSIIHGPDGEFMQMMKFFCTDRLRQPVMPYFGKGENLVQPISVRDVAACFARCLTLPETVGREYDLGGPERFTWKELYDVCALSIVGKRRMKVSVPVPVAKLMARTVIPLAPSFLVPYKFNVGQVQMSQEDSVCDTQAIEKTFGLKLRDFREELSHYADQIR